MRTPTLQYLYLQKPVTMVVVICIISVLPWIGVGDFCTPGEPHDAAVAASILESGNWVLPRLYAGEALSTPPLVHWLVALASYPSGHVTEFTARFPSAVAFTVTIGFILVFFGKRFKFQEAFIATLLLITSFGIHEAAMTTRPGMVLTCWVIIGLIQLYRWEEKLELKGLPVSIPLILGCAVLTGGLVGLFLPLLIFGVYIALLRKYPPLVIFKSLLYVFVSSLFLPALWYVAAWRQGGDRFPDWIWTQHVSRFWEVYGYGHRGLVYNLFTVLGGFMPWTLFFIFSLFGTRILVPDKSFKAILQTAWQGILSMHRPQLFGLVVIVCVLAWYAVPVGNQPVYLMPAYPFIALFLGKYTIYITEYRTKVTRVFAGFMAAVTVAGLLVILCTAAGWFHPVRLAERFTHSPYLLAQADMLADSWKHLPALSVFILAVIGLALGTVFYQMRKKINIKILYATIGLVFTLNLLLDGVVEKSLREGNSCKAFAEQIKSAYPLTRENVYVMQNWEQYPDFYGLNFYLGTVFRTFSEEKPAEGYFIATDGMMPRIESDFPEYAFTCLAASPALSGRADGRKIVLVWFETK